MSPRRPPQRHYRRYPWQQWADGRLHEIRRGPDFDQSVTEMVNLMHRHARRQLLKVQTKTGPPLVTGAIRFQFVTRLWWESYDKGDDQGE